MTAGGLQELIGVIAAGPVEQAEAQHDADAAFPGEPSRVLLGDGDRLAPSGGGSIATDSSIHSSPRSGYVNVIDSCTTRPTPAAKAALTTAAEPS